MGDSPRPLEERVAELEVSIDDFEKRQKDRKRRYAFDWYVKHQNQFYWKLGQQANRKTTRLAVTSLVVGAIGLLMAAISLLLYVFR